MNYRLQRNALFTAVVLLLFVSFGWETHNFTTTRSNIVVSLNRALQQTVNKHAVTWLTTDTIKAYNLLQEKMGGALSVHTFDKTFAEALPFATLRRNSGIQIRLLPRNTQFFTDELSDGYLMSDTILWMSPTNEASQTKRQMLSFRGYAECPFSMILSLSHPVGPLTLFCLTIILGLISSYYINHRQKKMNEELGIVSFGNLSLCASENCFYDEQHQRIRLTPLQYSLMAMFFQSSSHLLSKAEICQELWPGKDNAEETLYTLIRRLKPVIESNSNLYIKTNRGKAYQLVQQ
jgi:hypothetical protein